MTPPWYASYFSEPYGEVYANYLLPPEDTEAEARFAVWALKLKADERVLDCPCGYGRHMAEWKKLKGVVGLDLDADCLSRARADIVPGAALARGDMRALPFQDATFHAVVNLFNSFGYFSDKENKQVLKEWRRVLRPRGRLLIDIVNPAPLEEIVSQHPQTRCYTKDLVFIEDWRLDSEKQILTNHTTIQLAGKRWRRSYKLRLFTREQLEAMLEDAGFEIKAVWGDFDGEDFDETDSDRLIVKAVRK